MYTDPDPNRTVAAKLLSDPDVRVIHIWQHLTIGAPIRFEEIPVLRTEKKIGFYTKNTRRKNNSYSRKVFNIYVNNKNLQTRSRNSGNRDGKSVVKAYQPVTEIVLRVCPVTVAAAGNQM